MEPIGERKEESFFFSENFIQFHFFNPYFSILDNFNKSFDKIFLKYF